MNKHLHIIYHHNTQIFVSLTEPGAITSHYVKGILHFTDYADQYIHLVLYLSQYTGDRYIGLSIVQI